MRETTAGRLLVVLAAVMWSFGGLGIKWIPLDPLATAGYRSLLALPVLGLALALTPGGPHAGVLEPVRAIIRKC